MAISDAETAGREVLFKPATNAKATISPVSPREHIRRETLERIQHFLSKPQLRVYRDLKGMCDRVSDSYRDRVVVELLQNAHDAHPAGGPPGRIRIALDPDEGAFGTLYAANDGTGFAQPNFDALCSPTLTTKNVNEAIGNKGVGFLSVFQVSSHPEVYSRLSDASDTFDGFCFAFAADGTLRSFLETEGLGGHAGQIIASMPRLYLACPASSFPVAVRKLAAERYATVVRLPLKSEDALAAVQRQLALLSAETPPVQLFLPRIKELSVSANPADTATVLERHCELLQELDDTRLLKARCGIRSFIVAEKTVPHQTMLDIIARDIAAEALPQAWEDWTGDAIVSVAVALDGDPLEPRLYNFLPMGEGAKAPFSGYLDAPFFATLDRLRVQGGVEVNTFLLNTARQLALDAAALARSCLSRSEARQVVLDLVLWNKTDAAMRERVLSSAAPLVPSVPLSGRSGDWATFGQAKVWNGDAFLSPRFIARHAGFPIVDPELGSARFRILRSFVEGTGLLDCSPTARADIVAQVAGSLPRTPSGISKWNQFYRSLTELFRNDHNALAGRRILLTARGDLERTEAVEPVRGNRRRRLSAVFLPPRRGTAHITIALPKTVQRRLSFMHGDLELSVEGNSPARRFLLTSALVREHESREILRLLSIAISDPGETRDAEGLRWEALTAMMRIVDSEDTADGVVAEINPLVPTRDGWSRASGAYFSGRWPGTRGHDLEALFERAIGISAELDQHGSRSLRRYADWPVAPHEREKWVAFLKKTGVKDILRPVPVISGPSPREYPAHLQATLAQRSGLPERQRKVWLESMGNGWAVTNPQTPYSASNLVRLPGQLDFDVLAPVVGREYAEQVIRLIDDSPDILSFIIQRPLHQHAPNTRSWPSPVAAFLRAAEWIPLATGVVVGIRDAWLPGLDSRTPPPLLPIAALDFRQELTRHPGAADALRSAGLAEYGTRTAAWRFLAAAGELVTTTTISADAERLMAAAQDAWLLADLALDPPKGLRLLGRRGGRIASVDPQATEAGPFLVADGDDRQMVAASTRADPATIVIEPPTARGREIGAYLARHFPGAVRRASAIVAQYETNGELVVPDPADLTIEEALGDQVRQLLALTLRYRCSFYRGNTEETLARLSTIRVRKIASLSVRVGELSDPVPRFEDRAVLIGGAVQPTILYSDALAASDRLLVGFAPAIGAALNAPHVIGEPLLAFAAELGPGALDSSHEDYAAVLGAPIEDIRGFLGAARASVGNLLRTLRPLVAVFAGREAANRFAPGLGLASEDDVVAALKLAQEHLPVGHEELVRRCRESEDLAAIAVSLRLDLGKLNAELAALGPPYEPVDLTDRHVATLATFVGRNEPLIRESIRLSFRPRFDAGEDLSAYVAARGVPRVALPDDYGITETELPQARMQEWLDSWMADLGVQPCAELPGPRSQLDAVRDANLKQLRSQIPELRIAVLTRSPAEAPIRKSWASTSEAEAAVTNAALSQGWTDFDRLTETNIIAWLKRSALWPEGWPTLTDLAITEAERVAQRQLDERNRLAAATVKRQMEHSGGTFTFGVDAMGSLADQIYTLVAKNGALLNTSARTVQGQAPNVVPSGGGGGGGGNGGSAAKRMTEEERSLIGFFGESIAFTWLKRKFGGKRIVDESCWKSDYRKHICGEPGDDTLGYDFEVMNGSTRWLFEVKSTSSPGLGAVQSLELGPTEYRCAEACKADRRARYRILYITDALHPERASIYPLPNPRSRAGLTFFTDLHAGRRLYFPLKP
ncbi:MAG: ATP-binding protein [Mesorhizobium sp.]|uniref:ATP-binding protein n=1 Tax=Mesorhizobium sp. TaxID=1871066 RepID=UPI000FE6AD5C|nr:ATP-binding protein [Mesorhizobium sp.]RWI33316.1 MAG: ATP-binding protein [Mesorhizobium sp.]RWI37054.1 MAG: ATP-binding protein [Mesorhizobium sp.]RWI62642.1 MAG: ATP-binding protein [Mesorhizobium sp.]RWI81465.1 MAG: ATP-binding protein [Mesorhizobium sp.]RWJ42376.1 MAG: ATP-binding protein [Mesorhizobium sp.]